MKKHNISYDNLILLDLPSKAARQAWNKHGDYKALEYKKQNYRFFIESSEREARRIKELTGKSVFCTDLMKMI